MLLLIFVLLSAAVYRPFCRYICPLGAVYGPFNKFALYRFTFDKNKCVGCGACQKACKLDIPVQKTPNSIDCIRCGDCRRACPTRALGTTLEREHKKKTKNTPYKWISRIFTPLSAGRSAALKTSGARRRS